MKKILIFPYHPDIELLISHKKEWKDIVISGICSFREDHAIVHRLNQILGTSGEYRQLLRECDAVLLLDNFRDYKTEKYRQVIRDALAENKKVILVPRMAEELKADVSDRRISLLQHEYQKDRSRQILEGNIRYQRHTVETPVIAVAGMGKNCGKFECQIRDVYKRQVLQRIKCRNASSDSRS